MMQVTIETENCDFENFFLIEGSANSVVRLKLEIPVIVSRQSRKPIVDDLIRIIQGELSKFKWIIVGSVVVEFLWFLNAVERQETDKVGDMDNISKPVQDALSGASGIIVDDSQIGGLYTFWQSRNDELNYNVLYIEIKFNNDYVLKKKDLKFIQYSNAVCLPINIDTTSVRDLMVSKILIKSRLKLRKAASKIKSLGSDVDRYFVCSEYDFHRTRLNGFPASQILTINQLDSICQKLGINFRSFLSFFRGSKRIVE